LPVVVTNIGSNTGVVVNTVVVTVPAGGVPAQSHIVVCVSDNSTGGVTGSVADTAGNTYVDRGHQANNNANANGVGGIFTATTGLPLNNGDTITYTLAQTSKSAAVAAFYATGVRNDLAPLIQSAAGSSTSPSVTSGTPSETGVLFVGMVSGQTVIASFTQDSTNAAWASPPGQVSLAAPPLGGGNVVNAAATALKYNPTFGTSDNWAALVLRIRPSQVWGFEPELPRSTSSLLSKQRGGRIKGQSGFAFFTPFVPMGWAVQPPQPPHPRPERAGAVARGDDGTEAAYVFVAPVTVPWGHELTLQPPHPRFERAAATKSKSEFGIFPNLLPAGWAVQPPQPPHPRPERAGAVARGDDGTEAAYVFVAPPSVSWGYEQQSAQPPHPRRERSGAVHVGETGIEAQGIFVPQVGWDYVTPFMAHPRPERAGATARGDDGTQSPFAAFYPAGWSIQPPQPPHPRPERAGAVARGDDGTEAAYVFVAPVTIPWGHELTLQPPHPRFERAAATKSKSEFGIFPNLLPAGWAVQPPQPPHPRPERAGAVQVGDTGTQAVFGPPVVTVTWSYDFQQHLVYRLQRGAAIEGRSEFSIPPPWFNAGWEVPAPNPPHPRPERSAALMIGDDGTQGTLTQFFQFGWPVQSPQPSHPRPERASVVMIGDPGTQAIFSFTAIPLNYGFEFVLPTTLHPRPERAAATMRGDDGIVSTYQVWRNGGWEVQPIQPPHPRPERVGAILAGEPGIEAQFVFTVPPVWGWEVQPVQPSHRAPEWRGSAFFRGDDGTALSFSAWINDGWPIQSWQPPHFGRERQAASWLRGDDGTQAQFIVFKPTDWPSPFVYPRPQWTHTGSSSFMRGEDGTESQLIRFVPLWDNPVNIPITIHPRPERSGLLPPTTEQWLKVIVSIAVTFAGAGGLTIALAVIHHVCEVLGSGVASNPTEPPGSGTNKVVTGPGVATNPSGVGPGAKVC
jgi:hypothetical protein